MPRSELPSLSVHSPRVLSYRDLDVWREAMVFVRRVYDVTRRFPRHEMFALTTQLRRAATAVPSNIAEGNGRRRRRDYIRFVLMARSSLYEVETQLLVAADQAYLDPASTEQALAHSAKIGRMLNGLVKSLARLPHDRPED